MKRSALSAALFSLLPAIIACPKQNGGSGSAGADDRAAPAEVVPVPSPNEAAAEAASEADAAREAAPPRRTRTQEDLQEEATQHLSAASAEAKEKKPDCDKIVDLLDVSFATVGPAMTGDDRAVFAVFASCAKKAQRWRLLHAVANAIIAGDATQKTTYFLPRALLGLGQYDVAARLSSASLRSWPKEGEAYTTGALASSRLEDWESCSKEADQALLVQRQKGLSDEISAQAHVFKAEALLHQGKIEESSHELDVAKKIKGAEGVGKLRERNDVVKSSGLLLEGDMPDEVPLGIYPLLAKSLPLTGGLVTLRLTNTGDKPIAIRVEVSLADVGESVGKTVTVVKGRRETMKITPPLKADFKPDAYKSASKHELAYKVSTQDGQVLYQDSKNVSVLPRDELPLVIQLHQIDTRPVPELAAAWVTPAAKTVTGVLEAAKKRAPDVQFTGTQAATLPQVKAVWDELRERGFSFVREPSIDSEAQHAHPAHLPSDVIEARGGHALEGSLLFASLLEGLGLEVVLVRTPGHAFVGWLPSKSDKGTSESMTAAVQSPVGTAFFLDTTMVSSGPVDAAVLRGAAEIVDAASKKVFEDGRGSIHRLAAVRKLGVVAQAE